MTEEAVKVLYIGGYGRSGSTLLVRLLGQLPGFHATGEMWLLWEKCFVQNELCSCGLPFRECVFWSAVVEEAFGGFDEVDIAGIYELQQRVQSPAYLPAIVLPYLRSVQQRRTIADYQEVVKKLYCAIQKVAGCRVIIDSSKGPRYAMLLREIAEIDLRIVHLARDSRAVVHSWQRIVVKPEVLGKTVYMDRPTPVSAALNWSFSNLLMHSLATSGAQYRFVRYEDLVEEPQSWLSDVVEFVGENDEEIDALARNGAVNLTVNHIAVGNPSRFRHGAVELQQDDEWRTKMATQQKQLVTSLTLPLLQRYGYLNRQLKPVKRESLSTKFRP